MESESKHPYSQHTPSNQVYPPPASAPVGYPAPDAGNPSYVPQYVPQYAPAYPNAPEYNFENNPAFYQQPNYVPIHQGPPPPAAYYPNPGYPNASPYPIQPIYSSGVPGQVNSITSKNPTEAFCKHCSSNVTSQVLRRPGNTAWIVCLVLCCFCFPLCLYPLICDPCLDTYHICPRCQSVMSVRSP